jgi:fermentation-respiration switch protein FrsA (DUF1100 family)
MVTRYMVPSMVPRSTPRKILRLWLQLSVAAFAWSLILLGLPIYCFFCPVVNTPLLDKLATWPIKEEYWTAGREFSGVPCEQLTFPVHVGSETLQLSGAFYKHPKAKDIILVSHGNGGSLSHQHRIPQIAYMLYLEHSVFIYDYEGYGVSEGHSSYRSLSRDGVAAFDYVQQNLGYTASQIVLYGLSMGTGVSCEIARVRSPRAIVLDSAYTSAEDAAKFLYPFLRVYPSVLFPEPRYDNLSYLRGKHPPVLVITPLNDGTVPPIHGLTLAKEASPSITFLSLPHSSHTFVGIGDEKLYTNSLQTFFKQTDPDKTEEKSSGAQEI